MNQDTTACVLAAFTNGVPDSTKVWASLTAVGTADANSSPLVFTWNSTIPKDPQVYQYGMLPPGTAKASLTVRFRSE